jgi:hypothetical protein
VSVSSRLGQWSRDLRAGRAFYGLGFAPCAALHLAGAALLYQTEEGPLALTLALLTWTFLNLLWIAVLRRPAVAAALSFVLLEALLVLSEFKFNILSMTISFFDFLIVDADTVDFLLGIFPEVRASVAALATVTVPALILLWWVDPFRIRRRTAAVGAAICLSIMVALGLAFPEEPWEAFWGVSHISKLTRSGVQSISEIMTHSLFDSDTGSARLGPDAPCRPAGKPPHIIMVLDESSFDVRAAPGTKVPAGYGSYFRSFDGQERALMVEGHGAPTWYTEYNVLTGLSARSYGRFRYYLTRIAAGRVFRGLPLSLRRCGYETISLYPAPGGFLGARRFQTTTGIEHFFDLHDMGESNEFLLPDRFYFDLALRTIARERGQAPLFIFTYLAANHFPWTSAFRPDLTPDWQPLGNSPEVDEYIRRQTMTAKDYADFRARLAHDFPSDSFLIVRFGDHQPSISASMIEPGLSADMLARRLMTYDPRYFATYYAIDTVNFAPADVSSALDRLDAAYLPLVVQEAAGLSLDASFVEQKQIFSRCAGVFYDCGRGAEARRFNGLLIAAKLIKGL